MGGVFLFCRFYGIFVFLERVGILRYRDFFCIFLGWFFYISRVCF